MARIVRPAASRMNARSSGLFTIRSASKTAVASCMRTEEPAAEASCVAV